jgi:hypothetical protein
MSEKVITRQQVGLVRRQKRAIGILLIALGPSLVASSLCRGQGSLLTQRIERSQEQSSAPSSLGFSREDMVYDRQQKS